MSDEKQPPSEREHVREVAGAFIEVACALRRAQDSGRTIEGTLCIAAVRAYGAACAAQERQRADAAVAVLLEHVRVLKEEQLVELTERELTTELGKWTHSHGDLAAFYAQVVRAMRKGKSND